MKGAALYICYYHITDPLVWSQVVAYLRGVAQTGVQIHLLTFEREQLSPEKRDAIRAKLEAQGIHWHTLRYHQRPSLPATLYDTLVGTWTVARLCRRHGIRMVHARSHVPGAMALLLKRLRGIPFLFDLRGLMAEEYADAGRWSPRDLKYRLTKSMERKLLREADAVVMLTHRIKEDLISADPELSCRAERVQVIPCCVEVSRFAEAEPARGAYRAERGWDHRTVLVYVGKVGTWYRPDAIARFFRLVREEIPNAFLQIYTQDDPTPARQALLVEGIDGSDYDIRYGPPDELPKLVGAADAAISFRAGELSKRAASPTKVGEYLAAGIPVVTVSGIGDCDEIFERYAAGVVLEEFDDRHYRRAAAQLRDLLADPAVRERCRHAARQEFDLEPIGIKRYSQIYHRILRER
jgi:glycosyltransferase involved in cell wall biosynthesis